MAAPGMQCGDTKVVDGRKETLVCNLPRGHEGPRGFAIGRLEPFIRWGAS